MNMLSLRNVYFSIFTLFVFVTFSLTANANDDADHDHSHPAATDFVEGTHYHRVTPAVPTSVEEGKIEVLELFWYGCPHCFEFETYLVAWKETIPENVNFVLMPAVLNRGWVAHARAFYALETMGELERIHPVFFEAIHEQGRRLRDAESMARFLAQHDVDADKFKNAYDSLYVETKIKRAEQMGRQYGAHSVPQVIVNGKYRISASDAGGHENLLRVVDMLVEQEASTTTTSSISE